MFRKLTLSLVVLLVVLLRADTADAVDQAACCLPTTSRLDSLMNPTKGSDEKFFSRPGGPPNVLFLIDTSGSMHAWPKKWPATRGCSDAFLNGLGYDKNEAYDRLWTGLSTQSNDWWANNSYYDAPADGYGTLFGVRPNLGTDPVTKKAWAAPWTTAANACSTIPGISTLDQGTCRTCLDTQGYYIHDADNRRVKGNFLNFYAPRDSGAVKVLADVVRDLREVRFGVMAFRTRDEATCWGTKQGTNNQCLCLQQPMGPTCAKSYPLDNSSVESNRNAVLNGLTNVNANNKVGLEWSGCNTPLADSLYAAGYYFQSKSGATPFSTYLGTHPTSSDFDEAEGVCFECGFNAVILLTDGEPSEEGKVVTLPDALANDPAPCPGCSNSNLHKVAKFLWQKDLRFDMAGQQRVATYTIGFSEDVEDSKLLQETARLGGGRFFPAKSTSELKRVVLSILDDINSRNTAFSSAAVSTLQSQSSSMSAVVPRMMPAKGKAWSGRLYRYEQYNEFVQDADKNGDKDVNDVFLLDKAGDIVAEDSSSDFRKLVSQTGGPGGTPLFGGDAEPIWEANEELKKLQHQNRNIWTVTDNGRVSGGIKDGLINDKDALVNFSLENIGELRQYLSISGAPLCPSGLPTALKPGIILDKMGVTLGAARQLMVTAGLTSMLLDPVTQDGYDLLCAALVIQYVRGQDLFDEDGDQDRGETRQSVLGDIFHSSPVVVEPPAEKFLCDLSLSNQCVRTLYDQTGTPGEHSTELVSRPDLQTSCAITNTPLPRDAYDAYQYVNRMRERLILVGANDGMLHAFSDGVGTETENEGVCSVSYPRIPSEGGKERWAFIPSDLLSRLQEMLEGHSYYVDGDIMVRDIWADLDGDGKKSWNEYRTVAVVAEGRGGTHYFALELLWKGSNSLVKDADTKPNFRWMFPQPCTDEALRFGKTLFSLSPKPPPIGPVLLSNLNGQKRHGEKGPKSSERWVAMLSGGWSPGQEKGRGIYMVDVWNGQVNGRQDNLLWKWDYTESPSGDAEAPRRFMTYGFAAPVALADYGSNTQHVFDGFFDTAVVGDLGGQLWTMRFFQPGVLDDATRLIRNWSGGRSFTMDRETTTTTAEVSIRNRSPFYYLASLVVQSGEALRAFLGTGNRYSLLESGAGTCRFDNPQACSKLGCGQTQVTYKVTRNDADFQRLGNEWGNGVYRAGRYTPFGNSRPTNSCSVLGDRDFIKAEFEDRRALVCPTPTGRGTVGYEFARTKAECGQDLAGNFTCRVTDPGNTLNMSDLDVNPTSTLATLGKNRYFGVWVYGTPAKGYSGPVREFEEGAGARAYDEARLTDTGGTKGTGHLVNVTNVTCDAKGNCSCVTGKTCPGSLVSKRPKVEADPDDLGWFYEYEGMDHKTAGGSSVLASCALWNSMYPGPSSSAACAGANSNLARLHQSHYLTGAPNCASSFFDATTGFARYQDRSVLAPPPEPSVAIQISKTGKVKYSTLFVEPGKSQATEAQLSSDTEVLKYIYELPVSQGLHNCRHVVNLNEGPLVGCVPSDM